jgi:DeoR/GlpR family transcriptional regulator of sugar metabolism
MAVITQASELGLQAVCLGGRLVEAPCMLLSAETVENAKRYQADKAFISTGYVAPDGRVGGGGLYAVLLESMVQNSKQAYLLADAEKFEERYKTREFCIGLSALTGIITNHPIDETWRKNFPSAVFIEV